MRWLIAIATMALAACATGIKTQPAGTRNGQTQYSVECENQDEKLAACQAAIAKRCPRGHTMTGYDDQVVLVRHRGGPLMSPPRYLYFVCTP